MSPAAPDLVVLVGKAAAQAYTRLLSGLGTHHTLVAADSLVFDYYGPWKLLTTRLWGPISLRQALDLFSRSPTFKDHRVLVDGGHRDNEATALAEAHLVRATTTHEPAFTLACQRALEALGLDKTLVSPPAD